MGGAPRPPTTARWWCSATSPAPPPEDLPRAPGRTARPIRLSEGPHVGGSLMTSPLALARRSGYHGGVPRRRSHHLAALTVACLALASTAARAELVLLQGGEVLKV